MTVRWHRYASTCPWEVWSDGEFVAAFQTEREALAYAASFGG
jgi:hypothetical protein